MKTEESLRNLVNQASILLLIALQAKFTQIQPHTTLTILKLHHLSPQSPPKAPLKSKQSKPLKTESGNYNSLK